MNVRESLRISWRSITAHKLRSTLTTLGVIIGVAAVITFMVLGGGFTRSVISDIEADQEPVMLVNTQTDADVGVGPMPVDAPVYTESDIEALEEIDGVSYVAPQGELDVVQIGTDEEQLTGVVTTEATSADRFEHDEFVDGEPFDAEDEAVVNEQTAELFEADLKAGDELTLRFQDGSTTTFTITGIIEGEYGEQTPPQLFVPTDPHYTTTVETPDGTEERAYPNVLVGAEDLDEVDDVKRDVATYLETESHAAELKEDDHRIEVQTVEDAIEEFMDIVDQLTGFVAAVAGIALVVGSIGIANIMIVSVTERTRQIGIMKAVGGRKRDIMQLFLLESVILGVIGAVVGVFGGLGIGYLAVSWFGWPMAYPVDWIGIAIVVGVGVGVVSGLYPAWRGARVDPIEALRHE